MLRFLPLFSLVFLASCTFYQGATIQRPQDVADRTRVYLHTARQDYELSNISFNKSQLTFSMDSLKNKVSDNHHEYLMSGATGNEVHLHINDWSLVPGKTVTGDNIYVNVSPMVVTNVKFFTPSDYRVLYSSDIRKAVHDLNMFIVQEGKYYKLTDPSITGNKIYAGVQPYAFEANEPKDNSGLVFLHTENLALDEAKIALPFSTITKVDYQLTDPKKTFLAAAAAGTFGTALFLITLFATTDLENSDD